MVLNQIVSLFMFLVLGFAFSGCASQQVMSNANGQEIQMNLYLADKPADLKAAYKRLFDEGQRNAVLNQMRVGINAYQLGYKKLAAEAFDKALRSIESVFADNENAAKARSLWYEEGMKDFKGEPYERAMSYYYRGLLFLEDGDYENARAAFKSGIIQDAFAEELQMRCDFAVLILLEGYASKKLGDSEMFEPVYRELKRLRPDLEMPLDGNVLILVETGKSPRKVADGPGHSELKFRRGKDFTEKRSEISIDGDKFIEMYPIEDIFWQASTRGSRAVDKILQGKVVFRETNERISSTLTDISSTTMIAAPLFNNSRGIQAASVALGIFGVAQMVLAAQSNPHADTRYWNNLPDTIHIHLANLPEGEHQLDIRFKDDKGNFVNELTKVVKFRVKKNKTTVLWIRSHQQLN